MTRRTKNQQHLSGSTKPIKFTSLSLDKVKKIVSKFVKKKSGVSATARRSLIDSIQSARHLFMIRESKLIEFGWSDHRWRREFLCKISEWKHFGVREDCGSTDEEEEKERPPAAPAGGGGNDDSS